MANQAPHNEQRNVQQYIVIDRFLIKHKLTQNNSELLLNYFNFINLPNKIYINSILNADLFSIFVIERKTKKYHTVGTVPKTKKYHTVGTVPKTKKCHTVGTVPKTKKYHTVGTVPKTKKYHTVGTVPKTKKYHTVGTVPKSYIKIVERDKIDTLTQKLHDRSLSWLAITTCIRPIE
jgi:hypothetical protein